MFEEDESRSKLIVSKSSLTKFNAMKPKAGAVKKAKFDCV